MNSEFLRLFVALPVPREVRNAIGEFQTALGERISPDAVRWTPAEQIHLTLKFLGKVPAVDLTNLRNALAESTVGIDHFQLKLGEIGAFPSTRRARVLWIGLAGDLQELLRLQDQIACAIAKWCEKDEGRSFAPHLTIGRVRQEGPAIGAALKVAKPPECEPWMAGSVLLMQSELSSQGAYHSTITELSLRAD